MTPEDLKQHVDTIVVVMMVNCSFDYVLGYLSSPPFVIRPAVAGIDQGDVVRLGEGNAHD